MSSTGAGFQLREVSMHFDSTPALRRVNLEVEPGEIVGLVGPSGAGKTTLLRLLNGTMRPTVGSVGIEGQELGALSAGRRRRLRSQIAMVHQDLRLVPQLRVVQNVLAGRLGRLSLLRTLRWFLWPPRQRLLEVYGLLDRVGIADQLYQRTDRLSGGQQQRVAIARALFQEPRALLADEPVASVDPARARDTIALLIELCREQGLTLVLSLHNLRLAQEFVPRLVGLRRGEVVFDRPTKRLGPEVFNALYQLDFEGEVEGSTA